MSCFISFYAMLLATIAIATGTSGEDRVADTARDGRLAVLDYFRMPGFGIMENSPAICSETLDTVLYDLVQTSVHTCAAMCSACHSCAGFADNYAAEPPYCKLKATVRWLSERPEEKDCYIKQVRVQASSSVRVMWECV